MNTKGQKSVRLVCYIMVLVSTYWCIFISVLVFLFPKHKSKISTVASSFHFEYNIMIPDREIYNPKMVMLNKIFCLSRDGNTTQETSKHVNAFFNETHRCHTYILYLQCIKVLIKFPYRE